jgi:hypothetical protein
MRRRKYSSQDRGHSRKQAIQATVEGDLHVYTSFVELLGHSSRNFTAWWPDPIAMKIEAIIEPLQSAGPIFVTAWSRLSGGSFVPDYLRECAGGCDCIDRNTESQPTGARQRFAPLTRRKSSTYGVDYAGR